MRKSDLVGETRKITRHGYPVIIINQLGVPNIYFYCRPTLYAKKSCETRGKCRFVCFFCIKCWMAIKMDISHPKSVDDDNRVTVPGHFSCFEAVFTPNDCFTYIFVFFLP